MYAKLEKIHFAITVVLLLLFGLIGWYTLNRVSGYVAGNRHLTNVLSMIRDIDQLIVREKEPQRLIQKSCDILTSSHIYDNAWIFLYDDADKVMFSSSCHRIRRFYPFQGEGRHGVDARPHRQDDSRVKPMRPPRKTLLNISSLPMSAMAIPSP